MRKFYILILLVPIFSIAQKLEGQKLIDSILVELPKMKEDTLKVNLLNKMSEIFIKINPQNGIKYANQSKELAAKINWEDGQALSFLQLGNNQVILYDFKNAILNFNKALKLTKNKRNIIRIYRGIGNLYSYKNNFIEAIKYFNKAMKIADEQNNESELAFIYANLGSVYGQMQEYQKAIILFEKSLIINKKNKNTESIIGLYGNLANCYNFTGNYSKALAKFNEVLIYAKLNNNKNSLANAYRGIGRCHYFLGDFNEAITNTNMAIFFSEEIGNVNSLGVCNGLLADIYLDKSLTGKNNLVRKNDLLKAYEFINISLSIKKNEGATQDICSDYEVLSQIQKLQGNFKEALESHEQYTIYKDSIYNSENKETIKNLEDKREIELRDKEIKINKLSLEAKEKQKWLFVAGIGFLAIIGGLLFYQSRKRKLTNLKLENLNQTLDQNNLKLETLNKDLDQANKAKTRFFGILNHDLRGPVSNLVIFLQLQQEAPEMLDEESTKRMQDKTMTGAKNLLASMEDILQWSKSQMENFKPQPKNVSINQLFDDTKKVFSGYLNIKIEYQNPENIEIFTDDNYLKTIIRNLTSNSINVFTDIENPIIIWKAWQIDKVSYLSITDNGPGANPEKLKALFEESELGSTKSGLGLHLIRDMAKAIDCEISVESTIGIGTTFTLKIK